MPYSYLITARVLYSAIDITAHSRPLNSLEHCICTTSMTNRRTDQASLFETQNKRIRVPINVASNNYM